MSRFLPVPYYVSLESSNNIMVQYNLILYNQALSTRNIRWTNRLLLGVHHHQAISNQALTSTKVPRQLLSIRGGDIQVITSLSEVESIIEKTSEGDKIVVLDFTANNCPPCEMIAPIYREMSELEEFNNVLFLKVNVSDHPDIAKRYDVDGWPTFLLFKNGEKVDGIVGGQAAKAGLYSLVAKYAL
ncbi:hypothetical protein HJC23_005142 [Cyclotella cryptica]|uniref:Thioredoxin domain-containing protein n=1 Tax=Cyclotella cryptica TaxID=29204 RepID=A0ABD3QGK6_9STRA